MASAQIAQSTTKAKSFPCWSVAEYTPYVLKLFYRFSERAGAENSRRAVAQVKLADALLGNTPKASAAFRLQR